MLLRLVCLVHQGLPSSYAKPFYWALLSVEQLGAPCQLCPRTEKAPGRVGSPSAHACQHVGSSALAPGQPLVRDLASVFFKPKYIISHLHLSSNQIQCLNDWDPGSFSIFVVDKSGKSRNVCSFPLVFDSCAVSATLHHFLGIFSQIF